MSNAIFPSFRGLTWDVKKTPNWDTIVQSSASGREVRVAKRVNPIWDFELVYSVLDDTFIDGSGFSEFRDQLGLFLQRQGAFDSFLYQDPTDKSALAQLLGYGDGVTAQFQLARNFGGFAELMQSALPTAMYINGVAVSAGPQPSGNQWYCGLENLLAQSQAFNLAPWVLGNISASNPTVTANSTAAPDGTTSADTLAFPTTTPGHEAYVLQNAAPVSLSGTTLTFSVWLKCTSGTQSITLTCIAAGNGESFSTTATVTTSWTRFTVTGTFSSFASGLAQVYLLTSNQAAQTVFAWGAQLERWTSATSYVATTSVSPVTPRGLASFTVAPGANLPVTADFSYYYRVRFAEDSVDFNNFLNNLWECKSLKLKSVKI